MSPVLRAVEPDELAAWFEAFGAAFYIWASDPHATAALRGPHLDLSRTIAAWEGDQIVGTVRTFTTPLTLPGGQRLPVSAVTAVSTRPTHRRRGILTAMMVDDLRRANDRGDFASILIASEWPIYGRFGYGPATWHARWTLRTRAAGFQLEPVGSIDIVQPLVARSLLPEIYGAYAAAQPGEIDRSEQRWDLDLGLIEMPGRPRWKGAIAIHRDPAGRADGYARYHGDEQWEEGIPDNVLTIDELHGASLTAELDLWRHLASMDLTASIVADTRREHEPFSWYLTDARAARVSKLSDFLWLRPLDVERLLAGRSYDRDGRLVLEVEDQLGGEPGPAAGRYRLEIDEGRATCTRTTDAPDLTISCRALGAAVLGGTRLGDATRVLPSVEHTPGSLRLADALLRTAEEPWCTTWF